MSRRSRRRRRIRWLIFVVAALLLTAGGATVIRHTLFRDTPEQHARKGRQYLDAGRVAEAVIEYRHLGLAYFKAGDWKRSKVELDNALRANPDIPGADEARKALRVVGGGNKTS